MSKILNPGINFPIVGKSLFILAGTLFGNSIIALLFSESVKPFILSGIIAVVFGVFLYVFKKRNKGIESLTKKDASLIVTFSWLLFSIIGA